MKRIRRILLVIIGIICLLGFAARLYLTSGRLGSQVASRLEALYGGPVRVARVDIGWTGSVLSGVQLLEKSETGPGQPWLTVAGVKADVSVLSLLRGNLSPQHVTLTDATVTLRFDSEGRLLLRLPERPQGETTALPNLRIERGRFVFQKEGAADLIFSGIDAALQDDGERLVVIGAADNSENPAFGQWTFRGAFDRQANQAQVALRSEAILHVTPAMLHALPFVPPTVWRAVQVEGDTPVSVVLRYDLTKQAAHYRVELQPRQTDVHVAAIDLDATAVKGTVIVEDSQVQLRDVRGQAFEGTIRTEADLDFQQALTKLSFSQVAVQGLNMRRLPESWELPRQIEGRLKGTAKLEVVLGNGKIRTRGAGQGDIEDAKIGGQPASEPIHLELHAREGGFGFRNRNPRPEPKPEPDDEAFLEPLLPLELGLIEGVPLQKTSFATRLVNGLAAGINIAVHEIESGGSRLVGWLSDRMTLPERKTGEAARFVQVNLKMEHVDLALFVKGLGLKLPFAVGGQLSYQVEASIPLNTATDLKRYRVKGSAHVAQFRLADIELDELQGDVTYANGVLSIQDVTGSIMGRPISGRAGVPGKFQGGARLQLVPLGELTANMKFERIPLNRAALLVQAIENLDGDVSGTLVAQAPAARLQALDSWQATAEVTGRQLQLFGWTAQVGHAGITLQQGVLTLANLDGVLEGAPLTGSAELRLAEPFPYKGKITLRDWDLGALRRLSPALRPAIPLEGRFSSSVDLQGTLRPLTLLTAGSGAASDLKVYGLKFKDLTFRWKNDRERLAVSDIQAGLYEGKVNGQAVIPLRSDIAGSVNMQMTDVDVGALAKALPGIPLTLEGRAGGRLEGTLPPAAANQGRPVALDVTLQAKRLRLQGLPAEQIQAAIKVRQGEVNYRFEGKMLGGGFDLAGWIPPAGVKPENAGKEGRLRLVRARLAQLNTVFGMQPERFPLRGLLDVEVKFRHQGADRVPEGSGQVVVSRARWGDAEIAGELRADIVLSRQELRLREISAIVGQGALHAQLALNLQRLERSWFTLSLQGVEASRALPAWPELAGVIEGPLEAHLRGRLGREWTGTGDLYLGRGKFLGVDVSEWRLPIAWSLSPRSGRGEITCHETNARVSQGRVTGHATLMWGTGLRTEGQLHFFNAELSSLLRHAADSTRLGSGRVTGRFDFAGAEMRSVDDLTGSVEATLNQTQAFQFPVFKEVAPFLGVQTSSTFESGEIRARLGRGVFRIHNLSLQRASLQISADGTIALAGRLDLDVRARTGLGTLDPRLQRQRFATLGSIPLVHLHVTGTTRNPNIRIEPLLLR